MRAPRRDTLSLVILTHRGTEDLLRQCLDSLERAGAPGKAQVCVGLNGWGGAGEGLARELRAGRPWVEFHPLSRTSRGEARNRLIPKTTGAIVYFLDDDTLVPEGFVDKVLAAFARHPEAPVVGGPNVGPPGAAPLQRAVDFLLRSPLGAGPMRARYLRSGTDRALPGWCFMLSNLGARREVFETRGVLFPADCASAEENLFLHRVERTLGRPVFSPDLFVYHHRRASVYGFCRQVFVNGMGRTQIARADPASLQGVTLLPAAFVLYLAGLAWRPSGPLAAPAALYAAATILEAVRLAVAERDLGAAWRLAPLFWLAHLSYAAGFTAGLFSGRATHGTAVWARSAA